MESPFTICIPIYPGVDLLDVAAPCEVFRWMGDEWSGGPPVRVHVAAEGRGVVTTRDGLRIAPGCALGEVASADLLWVPGGDPSALRRYMADRAFLDHLRRLAATATYVTSVCEGAMLLASAGLLAGFRATTHWAFIECLAAYPGITVVGPEADYPRFVVDDRDGTLTTGIRVTGGGVSSGLDEALQLVKLIAGEGVATGVQVAMQYFPVPPVHGALPSTSPACPLATAPA